MSTVSTVREVRIHVEAPPETLWAMVTDISRMGEWSPENEGGEWVDGPGAAGVGARFKGQNRRGKAKWSTTCEVTAWEPSREFAFAVGGSTNPETRWSYRFEPVAGGTDVIESFELVKPIGRFSRLLTRVTTGVRDREADMEEGMRQTLSRLKQAAETA